MKCKIEIDMDNAAFDYGSYMDNELSKILLWLSNESGRNAITNKSNAFTESIRDSNGNTVGTFTIEGD